MTSHPGITRMFEDALGIAEPWRVEGVAFEDSEKRFDIFLGFERGSSFSCGSCGHEGCKAYDTASRRWRHLDVFQHKYYFHAPSPRVQCPNCGIRKAAIPWVRPRSSQAIAVGVDEKAARRGHDYITRIVDLDTKKLIFATKNRTHDIFREFRERLEAQGGSAAWIREICMDVSSAYMKGAREEFPRAGITFDRFHVAKLVNHSRRAGAAGRAEAAARPQEHPLALAQEPRQPQRGRKGAARKAARRHRQEHARNRGGLQVQACLPRALEASAHGSRGVLGTLVRQSPALRTRAARALRENLLDHWRGILRWSTTRLSNGLVEGFNSLIQAAKVNARGYRTTRGILHMAYLKCANLKLDLPT